MYFHQCHFVSDFLAILIDTKENIIKYTKLDVGEACQGASFVSTYTEPIVSKQIDELTLSLKQNRPDQSSLLKYIDNKKSVLASKKISPNQPGLKMIFRYFGDPTFYIKDDCELVPLGQFMT